MARNTLEGFIRFQLADTSRGEDNKCTALALMHYRGSIAHELRTIKLGSREWEPKDLASLFQTIAADYAGGIEGRQQFEIQSFFTLTENVPQGLYPFYIFGEDETKNLGGLGTEVPSAEGLARQDMRHKEGWMGFVLQMVSQTQGAQTRLIATLSEQNQKLREESFDNMELSREMILTAAADTHAHEMEEKRYLRESEERAAFIKLLPAAVNRALGKEVFPSNVEDTSIMESIANDLSADELEMVMAVLSSKMKNKLVIGMLADRLTKIIVEKRASEKKGEAPGNGSAIPNA